MNKVILTSFRLSDVEDPEIYAAQPIWEWQQTEQGKWCMENCIEVPSFSIVPDAVTYGYAVKIFGKLTDENLTYFTLKWG
jgi:hypothetical protein